MNAGIGISQGTTVGIMQPYLFPYIGYFQLINACTTYVVLDDVNYIKKGWVNRNRILVNGQDHMFTIPLNNASQNKWIRDTEILNDGKWKSKFSKLIQMAYSKAPFFKSAFSLIEHCLECNSDNLADFIFHSQSKICDFLSIKTNIIGSSSIYGNNDLKAQDRILDICIKEKATCYINPIGGKELYDKKTFNDKHIDLKFIRSNKITYKQFSNEFVPYLSIIDVIMFNNQDVCINYLNEFELE